MNSSDGLSEAMSLSAARQSGERAETRVAELETRIAELEARVAHIQFMVTQMQLNQPFR